ncbi:alpha/beta hydrolase [Metabacillus arenae]|uniref:Alpha/beta hydrolase n=1 Tax=Metabacillus arenae TaxID=2771434 RepID=A0A926NFK8_9BACI|nr:alpha/beta hydrolase [Metabacillus arenae]MBD1379603.1 alpha/beta hydrolase [Metabacillus arenae]
MWLILLSSILLPCLLLLAVAFFFSQLILFPRKVAYEETYKKSILSGEIDPKVFDSTAKEDLYIDSYHGYKLHGLFFPKEGSRKAIIVAHGIKWSLIGSFKYVEMFQKRGFHVLLCDHRFHGLSGGNHTSFGFYEKDDLHAWVDYLYENIGEDASIGLLGESLGAASALQYVQKESRASFCIADCPFSDLTELLKIRLEKDFKVKFYPLVSLTSLVTKWRFGWGFHETSPIKDIEKVKTPVMLIHGSEDHFIPLKMSKDLFRKIKAFKKLYIVPKAGHARAFLTDPQTYEQKVAEFFKEIGLEKVEGKIG